MTEILTIIDEFENLIQNSRRVPMSSSVRVDQNQAMALIDRMRISVPSSVKEGERMMQDRDQILAEARSQAEGILQDAEEEAAGMVAEEEIINRARIEADSLLAATHEEVDRMRADAEKYQFDQLEDMSNTVSGLLNEIHRGMSELQFRMGEHESQLAEESEYRELR